MNLSEINWDFNEAGTWPTPVKAVVIAIACVLVAVGGYYYDTADQLEALERLEQTERDLKSSFEAKQKKAINLPDYKAQLEQIEDSLTEIIKQMPTRSEVANLLVDISQTGLASGLEFRLFRPIDPVRRDFYWELPINIQVIGRYEELALFVSGLASLPRIVTVHNVKISPVSQQAKGESSDKMVMDATIKTYNEGEQGPAPAKPQQRRGRR
ncbi:type 4a pilus biogenesis protein PilO [Methylotuvimicrobium sp. KM2]|uniref:type 4a pilus biogenesis protein PilO n=1 Tax=Methylotuvimicrobium sp. KM2 TaxID=3133976 RepID=UPI003101ABB2